MNNKLNPIRKEYSKYLKSLIVRELISAHKRNDTKEIFILQGLLVHIIQQYHLY